MVDIHTHVLPGVDDGATSAEEAEAMLAMAAADGTAAMVATPHSDLRYAFDGELCRTLVEDFRRRAPSGLRLCAGCEVHLTPENIERVIGNPAGYTLGGGDCILLELPVHLTAAVAEPAIEALMDRGLRVVIAHPERIPYVQQNPAFAARLVEAGCFLQLTAGSIQGSFGCAAEAAALNLLNRRFVHFVASDGHGSTRRRPLLSAAFAKVASTFGGSVADLLFKQNPEAALSCGAIRHMPLPSGWLSTLLARSFHVNRKQQDSSQMSTLRR
jgi:protein-tyrosine phosphatase